MAKRLLHVLSCYEVVRGWGTLTFDILARLYPGYTLQK